MINLKPCMSDFDPMVEVALSMYLGETCPYCKVKFETMEDLKTAVYNGYTDYGRIAHRACFVKAHPDFDKIIKQAEEIHLLRAEVDRKRNALSTIFALSIDYDGYNTVDSLKSLIDEMRKIITDDAAEDMQ